MQDQLAASMKAQMTAVVDSSPDSPPAMEIALQKSLDAQLAAVQEGPPPSPRQYKFPQEGPSHEKRDLEGDFVTAISNMNMTDTAARLAAAAAAKKEQKDRVEKELQARDEAEREAREKESEELRQQSQQFTATLAAEADPEAEKIARQEQEKTEVGNRLAALRQARAARLSSANRPSSAATMERSSTAIASSGVVTSASNVQRNPQEGLSVASSSGAQGAISPTEAEPMTPVSILKAKKSVRWTLPEEEAPHGRTEFIQAEADNDATDDTEPLSPASSMASSPRSREGSVLSMESDFSSIAGDLRRTGSLTIEL